MRRKPVELIDYSLHSLERAKRFYCLLKTKAALLSKRPL